MSDASYGFYNINHKMNSTNGTQSSENESLRGDMSYLYGRDPSILAYGQRPFPSQESKKNLISLLEEEKEDEESIESISKVSSISTDISVIQTIKVFLRMKPLPRKIKLTPEQSEAYSILNSTTLVTKMPSLDNNTSCLKKLKTSETVCRKFIFSQTFGPETSQLELFEQAVKPQMINFLAGKNSIVMSYGTTNSGKTYTLQGTPESPGIIPRGIEFVFSNINPKSMPSYKAINLCDVIYLNNQERLQEMDLKMKLLSFNPSDKHLHVTTYKQMQKLLYEESPARPSHNFDANYSVWISFAEIYNEVIFDLLWNDCNKKRPALKLASDSRGRTYIKGLKSVCVNSGAEAYQVLMAGQYNLKVAATALNARSSRSHCIFTIKLLKYRTENDPHSVNVSVFTFCDLAGSERLKKTLNVGDRLKEAQNINTSLLVLGRCLKTIYEKQTSKTKNDSVGPFRESKLTRLFQRALSGKEQIALIVNVNPLPNLYVETQNVLNFSAIAKQIVIEHQNKKRRRSHSRFSRLITQKTDTDWENTELEEMAEASEECTDHESDIEENDQEAYEELVSENELLKKEIKELKAEAVKRDMQTRQEMYDMYSEIMKKLEADWQNRMIDMEEQQEDLRELAVERIEIFYKEKLNQLSTRKRTRQSVDDDEDEEDDKKLIEDFELENTRLTAKVDTLKKSIRDLKRKVENVETEKTKVSFELAVAKEEVKRANEMLSVAQNNIHSGDDAAANYIEELNEIIQKKDDRIKTMKTFLNEAKEEYILITGQAEKMENQLKERDELLAENTEHIRDLEEQLSQANAYSAEQNKIIEDLEEELEQQTKKIIESEEKVKIQSEKLIKSEEKIKNLSEQLTEFEEKIKNQSEKLIESTEKIKNQSEGLIESDEKIYNLSEQLIASKEKIVFLSEKLTESGKKKRNLSRQLTESEEKINNLSGQLTESEGKINNLSGQLTESEEKINNLSEQLTESEEKINNLSKELIKQSITENDEDIKKNQENENEELGKTNSLLEEMKAKFELSEKENGCLTEKLNQRVNEIQSLKNNLDSTKSELDKVKEKVNSLTIENALKEETTKQEKCTLTTEQGIQTETDNILDKLPETKVDIVNISCQTIEQPSIETDEKSLQTSLCLNQSCDKNGNKEMEVETISVEAFNELQKQYDEIKEILEQCKKEKADAQAEFEKIINENNEEISTVQQAMKKLIQSNDETVQRMEREMKNVLKDLTSTQDQLTHLEDKNRKMDKDYRQVIHILELKIGSFEQKLLEKNTENEKLKLKVEELKKSLNDMEHELEVFTRNRNETVSKYEELVKSQYDVIERHEREITRLQGMLQEVKENTMQPTPFKGSTKKSRANVREAKNKAKIIEHTSEEEFSEDAKTEKPKVKKEFLTPTKDNIPVVEVSTSSSKRSVRSNKEPVPQSSTRKTRKKRLFTMHDESYVDIEPSEHLTPSPCQSTRSLRNRRK